LLSEAIFAFWLKGTAMAAPATDTRVSLTKGQFLKIFRWQQQLPLQRLATLASLTVDDLSRLESDETAALDDEAQLASLLGCTTDMWAQIGVDPGFPGTEPLTGSATVVQASFAAQINRIAAMPEAFRTRQFHVIQKELGYIDS
jgi:hypothetical protein